MWDSIQSIATAAGALATALAAWFTFWMARQTKHAVLLQREQLVYSYSPKFYIDYDSTIENHPRFFKFLIKNVGKGPGYDAYIWVTGTKVQWMDGTEEEYSPGLSFTPELGNKKYVYFWPEQNENKGASNEQDIVFFIPPKYGMLGNDVKLFDAKVNIIYTDHLNNRYHSYCPFMIVFYNNKYLAEFPQNRLLKSVLITDEQEKDLLPDMKI